MRVHARDEQARDGGVQEHGGDAAQREEADGQGGEVEDVGELEGQRGPEAREHAHGQERDERGLREHGLLERQLDDAPQDPRVRRAGARDGVVGEAEEEQREDGGLQREGEPVDHAPGRVLRHDAAEEPRDEDAEHDAGHDDRGHGGAVAGWRVLHGQWEHELGRDGEEPDEEGEAEEGRERGREGTPQPLYDRSQSDAAVYLSTYLTAQGEIIELLYLRRRQ